jgi:DNA-binding NtrC family response regulator
VSISKLGATIITEPEEAKKIILATLEECAGDRRAAARKLGTTHRTFYRFIERLNLWDAVDEQVKVKGFDVAPGPPRSSKRIRDAMLGADGSISRAARSLGISADTLRRRISSLGLEKEINEVLAAAKLPTISVGAA